jgi:hypothetical protein
MAEGRKVKQNLHYFDVTLNLMKFSFYYLSKNVNEMNNKTIIFVLEEQDNDYCFQFK